jgi:hypothetical protein
VARSITKAAATIHLQLDMLICSDRIYAAPRRVASRRHCPLHLFALHYKMAD